MATYYHGGAEIQSDELQTLCLMNPGCVGYPPPDDAGVGDSPTTSNMMFYNSGALGHHQHLMGIPLHQNQSVVSVQDMASYNLWNPSPMTNNSVGLTSHLGIRQKGLSLSLLPEQKQINYGINQQHHLRFSGSESEVEPANGISGMQRVLLGSKYLKAAQQLLDDVVSVGKGVVKKESQNTAAKSTKEMLECEESNAGETSGKRAAVELSMTERQELQTKKAKLINMFDEAEKRYRQYYNQMQVVISSFEVIAGVGTAKTYTALALKTISKQFRCLRDALSGQIRATSKNLGEEDCQIGSKSGEGLTRLRFVDHHLRQQRALQQLGTMQHNAWRPQRGLPERSVSVLRAWLFEHFLHPYPKDSDKHILAKQTGLTRNQVSNWFINARVRLWKPMVEEMYLEETKAKEADRKCGGEAEADVIPTSTVVYAEEEDGGEENKEEKIHKKPRIRDSSSLLIDPMSTLEMELKPLDTATTSTNSNSHDALFMRFGETTDFGGGPYSIGDFARFGNDGHSQFTPAQQPHHHHQQQQQQHFSGNGVTLTLGLQHCDGLSLSGPPPATYLSSTNDSNHSNIPMGRRLQGLGNVTHDAREYNNSEYETLLSNQLLGQ